MLLEGRSPGPPSASDTRCREEAVQFSCAGELLVGVLSLPIGARAAQAPTDLGVVIVVGGPQYRAGSHRQFVMMARSLASAGTPVLRFDYRGMGDSTGELRNFEAIDDDIASAVAALKTAVPAVRRVVLWGLCDGASAALMFCGRQRTAVVAGLCLLNPWVRSETSLAKTQVKHYYTQRLLQREFWLKLLRGGVAINSLVHLTKSLRSALSKPAAGGSSTSNQPYPQQMASAWKAFGGPILLVLSGNDYTAKEFLEFASSDPAWAGALQQGKVTRHNIDAADHTLSGVAHHLELETVCSQWLNTLRGS